MRSINVVVIGDQIPDEVLNAIDAIDDMMIVAHSKSSVQVVDLCIEFNPDIILIDVALDGVEATQQVRKHCPRCRVLAFSSSLQKDDIQAMIGAGAIGYIYKESLLLTLEHALRTACGGKAVFSPEVAQILFRPS